MPATPPNEVMTAMLDRMDNDHLEGLVAYAQGRMKTNTEKVRAELLAEFEERAGAMGLSAAQIFGLPGQVANRAATSKKGAVVKELREIKFRSPTGQTWTGRGRKPGWLLTAEAAGETAESYRIAA